MTPQHLRQLSCKPGSPRPLISIEAAVSTFGPGQRWVKPQGVQKLDEWIWMGLADRDEAQIESEVAPTQNS